MDVLTLSRDFTINSMFYNISVGNGIVEDLVGSGLRDLQEGVIKTPIDAMVTFHDDPLRVLRAIRFAARFAYRLDESLASAAAHADIHHALLQKVSRERILKEMQGCMESNTNLCRPILALSMMQQYVASVSHCIIYCQDWFVSDDFYAVVRNSVLFL